RPAEGERAAVGDGAGAADLHAEERVVRRGTTGTAGRCRPAEGEVRGQSERGRVPVRRVARLAVRAVGPAAVGGLRTAEPPGLLPCSAGAASPVEVTPAPRKPADSGGGDGFGRRARKPRTPPSAHCWVSSQVPAVGAGAVPAAASASSASDWR